MRAEERTHGLMYTLLALAAIAVLAGVGFVGYRQMNGSQPQAPATVSVPYVINMLQDEASATLTKKGFHPVIEPKANAAAEGTVFDQNPHVNVEADRGSTVTIFVSTGPDSATIPYLRGQPENDAKKMLEDTYHLTVTVTPVNDASVDKGFVLGTDPAAGQSVPAKSPVTLQVASGQVKVPTVTGKTEAEARNILGAQDLKLKVTVNYERSKQAAGKVLRQTDEGKVVDVGTEITLVVSQAVLQTVTQPPVTQPPVTVTTTAPAPSTTPTPSSTKPTPSPSSTTPTPSTTKPTPSTTPPPQP